MYAPSTPRNNVRQVSARPMHPLSALRLLLHTTFIILLERYCQFVDICVVRSHAVEKAGIYVAARLHSRRGPSFPTVCQSSTDVGGHPEVEDPKLYCVRDLGAKESLG